MSTFAPILKQKCSWFKSTIRLVTFSSFVESISIWLSYMCISALCDSSMSGTNTNHMSFDVWKMQCWPENTKHPFLKKSIKNLQTKRKKWTKKIMRINETFRKNWFSRHFIFKYVLKWETRASICNCNC